MHQVVKPFRCSFDGINTVMLQPGTVQEFGAMAAGLLRAGLIAEPGSAQGAAGHQVEPELVIPANYASLSKGDLRTLAARLGIAGKSRDSVIAAVAAEIDRRTQAAAEQAGA
jgi:hypothetical protein